MSKRPRNKSFKKNSFLNSAERVTDVSYRINNIIYSSFEGEMARTTTNRPSIRQLSVGYVNFMRIQFSSGVLVKRSDYQVGSRLPVLLTFPATVHNGACLTIVVKV